ncbi:MAG TPA: LamG domain-containing protein [Verrucomicrobiae bacterium]
MNLKSRLTRGLFWCTIASTLAYSSKTQAALSDGLVSYWPMEEVQGTTTPDMVSGYNMTLNNLTAADLVNGKLGKCFAFSNVKQTLLSRVHGANDDLPANKHGAFTISFWANVNGTGQSDLRLFSEAFTPNNNNPLFNIGTHSTGSDGSVDLFIRQAPWTEINHVRTTAQPFDGTWHHVTFVQNEDGTRVFYVDGVLDELEIPARPDGRMTANDTTIGGILRASTSHWVTGLIDEVAIWKRALTGAEITQVVSEGLVSVFPPEGKDLVAHWPMEEVQGAITPDLVSGYDMSLNNLTATDFVAGRIGKAVSFSNARQTLLSRVHGANDDLPANKHGAFTISFWANVNGVGQSDLRVFSEAFTPNNNNPLFNIGTHSTGTDASLDLFIRQTPWTEINHIRTTAQPFDGTWHHVMFVQNEDGTRAIYVDGVLDPLEIPARPEGRMTVNDTTIGGILRASTSHWVTGLMDEVAIWKRALTATEIGTIYTNGVPAVISRRAPLEIKSFSADFPAVATGDRVMLRWEGSKDANFTISGVGDVTTNTAFGLGTREVVVSGSTTFELVATRGTESLTNRVSVQAVPGVVAGWHLIETFSPYTNGPIAGQSPWLGAEGVFVVGDQGGNKVLGYESGDDLTAIRLNSWQINEGQTGTLSFRMQVRTNASDEAILPITAHVGLTERSIRFNDDFNQNVGPFLRVDRFADDPTVYIQARNNVGGAFDGPASGLTLEPGAWYTVWMDVQNRAFDVVEGVQNGGDLFSVHIQKDGQATRETLFENYVADRDAIAIDPALGAPTTNLTHLFIATPAAGNGTNDIVFDEFFITVGNTSSVDPYTPQTGPTSIDIAAPTYNSTSGAFQIAWSSMPGVAYRIQRKSSLSDAWTTVSTVNGGAGNSTTFSEPAAGNHAFYQVVYQP